MARAFNFSGRAGPMDNTGDRASRLSGLWLGSSANGAGKIGQQGRQVLGGNGCKSRG